MLRRIDYRLTNRANTGVTRLAQPDKQAAIVYAAPGATAGLFQKTVHCAQGVARVVPSLRASIEQAGLWVLHEIDPQMLSRRGGYSIGPARQILFFHPRFVVRMLQADPASLLEAPLKLAVIEQPDGSSDLSWQDPAVAFERYGNPILATIGRELGAVCDQVVQAAIGGAEQHDVR